MKSTVIIFTLILGFCGSAYPSPRLFEPEIRPFQTLRIESVEYQLRIKKWKLDFLRDSGTSGPFEIINDQEFLFFSRCGLVSLAAKKGDGLSLVHQVRLQNSSEIYCDESDSVPTRGIKGTLIDWKRNSAFVAFQTESQKDCIALAVERYDFDPSTRLLSRPRRVFTSEPCLEKVKTVFTQTGGALAVDSTDHFLFISVGDFGAPALVLNDNTRFGKIIKLNLDTEAASQFATGLRNPQGLAWNQNNQKLYGTEHGPRGGDEINVINEKDNLGWPESTFGVDYTHNGLDHYSGPLGHYNYGKLPAIAFVPSIAPTGIQVYPTQVDPTVIDRLTDLFRDDLHDCPYLMCQRYPLRDERFANWSADLVFVSLRAMTLFRGRIDDNRIVFVEPLANIGERMRSLRIANSGIIYAKADPDLLIEVGRIMRTDPSDSHFTPFENVCGRCHQSVTSSNPFYLPLSDFTYLDFYRAKMLSVIQSGAMPPPGSGVILTDAEKAWMIQKLEAK